MRPVARPLALALSAALLTVVLGGCGSDSPAKNEGAPDARPAASAASAAVTTLIDTGLGQLEGGADSAARGTFESVLTLDPDNVLAHYNLGLIAQRHGQDARAATRYDAALEVDPEYAPALYNRGILTEGSDLEGAVALYQRAVAADPELAAAFMRLGFAQVHLGDEREGERNLGRGVSLDPSMTEVEAPSYR